MTANSSRSSSPVTPESLSDDVFQPNAHIDLSAWCYSFSPDSDSTSWDLSQETILQNKSTDDSMLFMDGFLRDGLLEWVQLLSLFEQQSSFFSLFAVLFQLNHQSQ